ncbi:hypothetical protein D3H55_12425 [Bacillus salacetis]|uniref:Uncharacterized protein n=1 Tax=Bacillus salacetis TaxID=2315464 RepID=A0A3A1QW76_9BACI|nr:hypothetical protein [Bacillus salacetis]RIW32683.1 hypothetical protein D3H55_12425 [Bacillus salacetis]
MIQQDMTKEYYFKELEEVILNEGNWNPNVFEVFNHEAGTGKSRFVQQLLGKMSKLNSYRVFYVQRFVRDDELLHTVQRINEFAEKEVAIPTNN